MKRDSSSHTDYRSKASSHHIKKIFEMKENSEKSEPYLFAEGKGFTVSAGLSDDPQLTQLWVLFCNEG